MANLLRKPKGTHGKVHDITPKAPNGSMSASDSIVSTPVRAFPKRLDRPK